MKNVNYADFVEKFKTKKTTDDCYTPPGVYDAVARYVKNYYGADVANFVRPFYPGGDFEHYEYNDGQIVVDNPPFSILSKIKKFYIENDIKFFLFAPTLTLFGGFHKGCCLLAIGSSIRYENGANVNTSFVTNMEEPGIRTDPVLFEMLKESQKDNSKGRYEYPRNVITSSRVADLSKHGVNFRLYEDQVERISGLDCQKGKSIFGGGFLIGDDKANEYVRGRSLVQQSGRVIDVYSLSDREKKIVELLNEKA